MKILNLWLIVCLLTIASVAVAVPDVRVNWSEQAGYPDQVDWNEFYDDVFTLIHYEIPVVIFNTGNDVLVIEDIFVEGEAFSVDFLREAIIQPDQSFGFDIVFNAEETGEYRGVLHICSNDPDEGDLELPLVAEALLPPRIAVEPGRIEEFMWAGQVEDCELIVGNEGESTLRFQVEHEIIRDLRRDSKTRDVRSVKSIPQRDDPGELLDTFQWNQAPENRFKAGIAWDWDNELMLITTYNPNQMAIVDPANDYEIVREWQPACNPMGAAWLDGVFYVVGWANRFLFRYDIEGNNLGNWGNTYATSVTTSQELGFIFVGSGEGNRDIEVWAPDGDRVGTIARANYARFINNTNQRSLCWVDKHPDGQLWINSPGQCWQVHVDNDEWVVDETVANFANGGSEEWDGIGHDGHNLWFGGYNLDHYRIFDDNVTEIYWLSHEPTEGVVEPGEEAVVTVTLNTTGLIGGEYEAELILHSNDPVDPELRVPVSFFMEGPIGIMPEWQEVFGYPDVIDFNGGYPDVFAGRRYAVPVEIHNDGVNVLIIDDIFTDNEYFHAELDIFELEPGDSEEFDLIFECDVDDAGEYNATLVIYTNNANQGEIDIPLHAEANELELVEQRFELREGWNMISVNVDPIDFYADLGAGYGVDYFSMFQQLVGEDGNHNVDILKDEMGRFWSPVWDFTRIPYWNLTEGYLLRVFEDCEVILPGVPIPADADIPLDHGWNIIAYFPTYDLDASEESDFYVLSPILRHVLIAKDNEGRFMTPEHSFSNMPPWTPGQGYMVKSVAQDQIILNYPEERERLQNCEFGSTKCELIEGIPKTGVNMSLLVIANDFDDAEIGVWANGDLIGSGVVVDGRCGIAVWGDDPTTPEIDGAVNDATLRIELNNIDRTKEFEILRGEMQFYTDAFTVVRLEKAPEVPKDFALTSAHPNPFNSTTTIGYSLPVSGNVSLAVYDLSGREVTRLVDGAQSAGIYEAVWTADNVSSGVYFLTLRGNDVCLTQKLLLVR